MINWQAYIFFIAIFLSGFGIAINFLLIIN